MDSFSLDSAAWDSRSLNDLKAQTAKDPHGNVKNVAQQVEGMFVKMMLKSMRDALPQDGMFSSDQTKLYTSFYDGQIAQQLSAKGLGLADMIVKQMGANGAEPDTKDPAVPMRMEPGSVTSYQNQVLTAMVKKALPTPQNVPDTFPQDNQDFLAQLALPARLASEQSGIPHHLILAQAALESGWGQRQIKTQDGGPSFNIFGVKAGANWKGHTTDITTTEFENGAAKKVTARFRVYGSYLEALSDYVGLLTRNPRYAAVTTANSPEQGAQALQDAGYATDPQYARKLTSMIQQLKAMTDKVSRAYSMDINTLF